MSLRHVRVRADFDVSRGWAPEDLAKLQPGQEAYPRFAIDAGGSAEVSWFDSRYLEERTGRAGVWGLFFGGVVRPDITLLMTRVDLTLGVNQPERLASFSELVGHWQLGVRLHGRLGF